MQAEECYVLLHTWLEISHKFHHQNILFFFLHIAIPYPPCTLSFHSALQKKKPCFFHKHPKNLIIMFLIMINNHQINITKVVDLFKTRISKAQIPFSRTFIQLSSHPIL